MKKCLNNISILMGLLFFTSAATAGQPFLCPILFETQRIIPEPMANPFSGTTALFNGKQLTRQLLIHKAKQALLKSPSGDNWKNFREFRTKLEKAKRELTTSEKEYIFLDLVNVLLNGFSKATSQKADEFVKVLNEMNEVNEMNRAGIFSARMAFEFQKLFVDKLNSITKTEDNNLQIELLHRYLFVLAANSRLFATPSEGLISPAVTYLDALPLKEKYQLIGHERFSERAETLKILGGPAYQYLLFNWAPLVLISHYRAEIAELIDSQKRGYLGIVLSLSRKLNDWHLEHFSPSGNDGYYNQDIMWIAQAHDLSVLHLAETNMKYPLPKALERMIRGIFQFARTHNDIGRIQPQVRYLPASGLAVLALISEIAVRTKENPVGPEAQEALTVLRKLKSEDKQYIANTVGLDPESAAQVGLSGVDSVLAEILPSPEIASKLSYALKLRGL